MYLVSAGNVGISTNGTLAATFQSNQNVTFAQTVLAQALSLATVTNQVVLGAVTTVTLNAPTPASSSVYTIPDVGTSANFVLTAGSQTIGGAKTFTAGLTSLAGAQATAGLKAAGIIFRQTSTQQNTSTTETDLWTKTILANTLNSAGDALVYKSNGSLANNGATKTIKIYYGASSVTAFAVTTANVIWRLEMEVSKISGSSERVTGFVMINNVLVNQFDQTLSIDTTADQTAKITAQGTTGTGDLNAKFFSIFYEPAST